MVIFQNKLSDKFTYLIGKHNIPKDLDILVETLTTNTKRLGKENTVFLNRKLSQNNILTNIVSNSKPLINCNSNTSM